ncbi:MAG: hypothetical protein AAF680_05340 [Pseudomonadota bacterium]
MAQRVINMCIARDNRLQAIMPLGEDGDFGPLTQQRITDAALALGVSGSRTGQLDSHLWSVIKEIAQVRVVDVIDLCVAVKVEKLGLGSLHSYLPGYLSRNEPGLNQRQTRQRIAAVIRQVRSDAVSSRAHWGRLVAAGGQPIALTDHRNPFAQIAREIRERSRNGWQVCLLRIQGHGSSASQGIAGSLLGWNSISHDDIVFDRDDSWDEVFRMSRISGMSHDIPRWGVVELHGCKIASRRRRREEGRVVHYDGPQYVRDFAQLLQRPVSAGVRNNMYGSSRTDYRIEGRVVSHTPGNRTLGDYFAANPA